MLQTLTQEQRELIEMLDKSISLWPNGTPKQLHLKSSHYKVFKTICNKKKKFPDSNANLDIADGVYRGVEILNVKAALSTEAA